MAGVTLGRVARWRESIRRRRERVEANLEGLNAPGGRVAGTGIMSGGKKPVSSGVPMAEFAGGDSVVYVREFPPGLLPY